MKRLYLFFLLIFLFHMVNAVELGELLIRDDLNGVRPIVYEKRNGFAIVEDDILLTKLSRLNKLKASVLLPVLLRDLWINGLIPYEISADMPHFNKYAIRQAMVLWQQQTSVHFIEINDKNRSLYPDHIIFIPITGTTCASYVGRQGGTQVILLAPRCNSMNTAHELGHAMGLWHEQSRSDRDQFVKIMWENIEPDHIYNFNQHLTDGIDFGEYDYQSIMHYPENAFSRNGEKTIVPLQEGAQIGQRDHITEKDFAAINALYPKKIES